MRGSEWSLLGIVTVAVVCILGIYGEAQAVSIVQVPNQASISSGYSNQVLAHSASGWGNLYGDVIPEQLSTNGDVWYSGSQLHWNVTANIMGTFMPHDGSITPKMWGYNLLGDQHSQMGLSTSSLVFESGDGWWRADFVPGLNVDLGLTTSVSHNLWDDGKGPVDYWQGVGNVSVTVNHGLITNSSSNFWRYDYNYRPSEWQAQFNFSGISMPDIVKMTRLSVPDPATLMMLGVGALALLRRRVA